MTLGCCFDVIGTRHDGVKEPIARGPNIVTKNGLLYLAATKKFKSAGEPYAFSPTFNAFFLGSDSTPTSFLDDGPKDLKATLVTPNRNNFTGSYSTFNSGDLVLPLGNYTELSIGYYDSLTGERSYYNRALLDTPLVIDAEFYKRYKDIELIYSLNFEPSLNYGRKSEITINDVVYEVNTFARVRVNSGEYSNQSLALEGYLGGAIGGRKSLQTAACVVTYNGNDASPGHRVMELKLTPLTAGTSAVVEDVYVRNGAIYYYIHLADATKRGVTIPAGKTLTLQLEVFMFPDRYVQSKVAEADRGLGYNETMFTLTDNYVQYNSPTVKGGYAINIETNERIDFPRLSFFYNKAEMDEYPISESEWLRTDGTNIVDRDSRAFSTDKTGIWKVYVEQANDQPRLADIHVGTATGKTFTFNAPEFTTAFLNDEYRMVLSARPSLATHVRAYIAAFDEFRDFPITVNGASTYAVFDAEYGKMLYAEGQGYMALRYYNDQAPAQIGVWTVTSNYWYNLSLPLGQINKDPTLLPSGEMTRPISYFTYDRNTAIISGQAHNATKLRIKEVDGNEVHEFDIVPYERFTIDITETNIALSKKYMFVAVGEKGESGGPVWAGFASVALPAITDAVYSAANATITFTKPSEFAEYAVLRRWGFEFYRLELTTGTNVLHLSETLDMDGQWELVALDENNSETLPFYIFGEKPNDTPVKPENTPPALNIVNAGSSNYYVNSIGFYPQRNSPAWWEGLTWHATVNGSPATVEFLGVKSRFDPIQYPNSYYPYLSFKISSGEASLMYYIDATSTENTAHWHVLGGYTQSKLVLKLWHDWKQYDGRTESDMYAQYGWNSNYRIYGEGNGYHQVTEIQSGFIRRAIGLSFDFGYNILPIIGGCPINFDSLYRELTQVEPVPVPRDMLSYMQVYFGWRIKHTTLPGLSDAHIAALSVRINDQATTVTEKTIVSGSVESGYPAYSHITWATEDGVAYVYNVKTGYFVRTDREEHMEDPSYSDITDTIQLCYSSNGSDSGQTIFAFESGETTGSLAFPPHIRALRHNRAWMSVKGWIRPYRSSTGDMVLTPTDLQTPTDTSVQFKFDLNEALLDVGNTLNISLNDEPATIVYPPEGVQRVQASDLYMPVTYVKQVPVGVVRGHFNDAYDRIQLPPMIVPELLGLTEYGTYKKGYYHQAWEDRMADRTLMELDPTAYEAYRLSLTNADEYLTYAELFSASAVVSYDRLAIIAERVPEELRGKKVCLPRLWWRRYYDQLCIWRDTDPDGLNIFQSGTQVSFNTLNAKLKNSAFDDATRLSDFDNATVIVGHYEATLTGAPKVHIVNYDGINGYTTGNRDDVYIYLTEELLRLDFNIYDDVSEYYNNRIPTNVMLDRWSSPYTVLCPMDTRSSAQLSMLLFGEVRDYTNVDVSNDNSAKEYQNRIIRYLKNGIFDVATARKEGLTGKVLLAFGMSVVSKYIEMTFRKNNPNGNSIMGVADSEISDYYDTLTAGKPVWKNAHILDYIEIDFSLPDSELANILTETYGIFKTGSRPTTYMHLGVSTTGYVKPATIDKAQVMLHDPIKGAFLPVHHTNVYEYDVTDPKLKQRRIVSENYELAEVPGGNGRWNIVRAPAQISDNPNIPVIGQTPVTLLIKTSKYNNENIFSTSATPAQAKITDDNVGHYLYMRNTIDISTNVNDSICYFTDPRQLELSSVGSLSESPNQIASSLYMLLAATYEYTNGFYTSQFPLSWGDELVVVEPAAGFTFPRSNYPGPYYEWFPAAHIRKQDGTPIATLKFYMQGKYGYSASLEMHQESPSGVTKVATVISSVANIRHILQNQWMLRSLNSDNYVAVFAYINYDLAFIPELQNFNFWGSSTFTDRGSVGNDLLEPIMSVPLPAWSLVETLSDFNANFNVYINGTLAQVERRVESVIISNDDVETVIYTLTLGTITINLRYYPGYGCYDRTCTVGDTTVKTIELVFESIKSYVALTDSSAYIPVFEGTYIEYGSVYVDDLSSNVTNSDYLQSGKVYDKREATAFFKPSAYFLFTSPDYIDVDAVVREEWKKLIGNSYTTAVESLTPKLNDMHTAVKLKEETWDYDLGDFPAVPSVVMPMFYAKENIMLRGFYLLNQQFPNVDTYSDPWSTHTRINDNLLEVSYGLNIDYRENDGIRSFHNLIEISSYYNNPAMSRFTPTFSIVAVNCSIADVYSEDELYDMNSQLPTPVGDDDEADDELKQGVYLYDPALDEVYSDPEYPEDGTSITQFANRFDTLSDAFDGVVIPAEAHVEVIELVNSFNSESVEVAHIFVANPNYDPEIITLYEDFKSLIPDMKAPETNIVLSVDSNAWTEHVTVIDQLGNIFMLEGLNNQVSDSEINVGYMVRRKIDAYRDLYVNWNYVRYTNETPFDQVDMAFTTEDKACKYIDTIYISNWNVIDIEAPSLRLLIDGNTEYSTIEEVQAYTELNPETPYRILVETKEFDEQTFTRYTILTRHYNTSYREPINTSLITPMEYSIPLLDESLGNGEGGARDPMSFALTESIKYLAMPVLHNLILLPEYEHLLFDPGSFLDWLYTECTPEIIDAVFYIELNGEQLVFTGLTYDAEANALLLVAESESFEVTYTYTDLRMNESESIDDKFCYVGSVNTVVKNPELTTFIGMFGFKQWLQGGFAIATDTWYYTAYAWCWPGDYSNVGIGTDDSLPSYYQSPNYNPDMSLGLLLEEEDKGIYADSYVVHYTTEIIVHVHTDERYTNQHEVVTDLPVRWEQVNEVPAAS